MCIPASVLDDYTCVGFVCLCAFLLSSVSTRWIRISTPRRPKQRMNMFLRANDMFLFGNGFALFQFWLKRLPLPYSLSFSTFPLILLTRRPACPSPRNAVTRRVPPEECRRPACPSPRNAAARLALLRGMPPPGWLLSEECRRPAGSSFFFCVKKN